MVLDLADLKRIFTWAAILTAVVTAFAVLISPEWGTRYGAYGTLALFNWFALAEVISGMLLKKPVRMIVGLMLKPLLIVLLLVVIKVLGMEITSFLAGVNTFFIALFGYIGWSSLRPRALEVAPQVSQASRVL